jgi:Hypothetical glycosyl hydrolase family 15
MRRLIFPVLVVASVLAAGAAPALASGQGLVVGHLRVAIDSNASFPDYSWTATHEQVVILQPWETSELYALKAADPSVNVLMYKNASAASSSAASDGRYSSGVSYDQAAANGWLLRNTSGSPFTFGGYSWLWAADIGNRAYQNAWASNVLSDIGSDPWDGVFIDDLNPTIQYHYCVTCVTKYPSDAFYGQAMGSFVQNVGPQLQSAGRLAIANIGSWSSSGSVVDSWLQYLTGGMDEMFLKWGTTAGTGYASPAVWATQLQEIKTAEAEGKLFIGITHSSNDDERAAVYGYATGLLAANGHSMFSMNADYTNETWFPEYNYAIGDPTGAESVMANGVHWRGFTGGLVLVNPTTSTRTVNLGSTMSGSGVTNVSSVTMGPQSGMVLLRAKSSRPPAQTAGARAAHAKFGRRRPRHDRLADKRHRQRGKPRHVHARRG